MTQRSKREARKKKPFKHGFADRCDCPKMSYTHRKEAKAMAAQQTRTSGELIVAYKCRRGGHCWHIGHAR